MTQVPRTYVLAIQFQVKKSAEWIWQQGLRLLNIDVHVLEIHEGTWSVFPAPTKGVSFGGRNRRGCGWTELRRRTHDLRPRPVCLPSFAGGLLEFLRLLAFGRHVGSCGFRLV